MENDTRSDKELRDIGGSFISNSDPEKAIPFFREAYRLNPLNEVALGEYGWALCEAGAEAELYSLAETFDLRALDSKRGEHGHDMTTLERDGARTVGTSAG